MTNQVQKDHQFVAAAVDFMEAGPDKFKPGYEQYRDLALVAARLAALSAEANDGRCDEA